MRPIRLVTDDNTIQIDQLHDNRLRVAGIPQPPRAQHTCVILIPGRGASYEIHKHSRDLGRELNRRGIDFLYGNTRGRADDIQLELVDGTIRRQGSVFERASGFVPDVMARIRYATNNYDHVVLAGHSLGCTKVIAALNSDEFKQLSPTRKARVESVVLATPVDMIELGKRVYGAHHQTLVRQAKEFTEAGTPEKLLIGLEQPWPISAGTFCDQHLPGSVAELLSITKGATAAGLHRIELPIMALFARDEEPEFLARGSVEQHLEALKRSAAKSPLFECELSEGGHTYSNAEWHFADIVANWTQQTRALAIAASPQPQPDNVAFREPTRGLDLNLGINLALGYGN